MIDIYVGKPTGVTYYILPPTNKHTHGDMLSVGKPDILGKKRVTNLVLSRWILQSVDTFLSVGPSWWGRWYRTIGGGRADFGVGNTNCTGEAEWACGDDDNGDDDDGNDGDKVDIQLTLVSWGRGRGPRQQQAGGIPHIASIEAKQHLNLNLNLNFNRLNLNLE